MDSLAPSPRHEKAVKAFILSLFLSAVGLALFLQLINTFRTYPVSETKMFSSPWATSALADYIVGACFGAMFIYMRAGPSFLFIPPQALALMYPFMGNFVLLWYAAFLLMLAKHPEKAFLPREEGSAMTAVNDKGRTRFIAGLFSALLLFFVGVCVFAFVTEDLQQGYRTIRNDPWSLFTFADNLAGILFTATFVVIREGGLSGSSSLWILAFALLGNAPTCIYILLVTNEAIKSDMPFRDTLLTQKTSEHDIYTPLASST